VRSTLGGTWRRQFEATLNCEELNREAIYGTQCNLWREILPGAIRYSLSLTGNYKIETFI